MEGRFEPHGSWLKKILPRKARGAAIIERKRLLGWGCVIAGGICLSTLLIASCGFGESNHQNNEKDSCEDNRIVCIGDSLTADARISALFGEYAYPNLLRRSMPEFEIISLAEPGATNKKYGRGKKIVPAIDRFIFHLLDMESLIGPSKCILDYVEKALELRPEYIVFWGGTNDLDAEKSESAMEDWQTIADKINGSCAKGIFFTLHYLSKRRHKNNSIENWIDLNKFIEDYVNKNPKNVLFRADKILSPDFRIDPAYDAGDGLHINADGHKKIADELRKVILKTENKSNLDGVSPKNVENLSD